MQVLLCRNVSPLHLLHVCPSTEHSSHPAMMAPQSEQARTALRPSLKYSGDGQVVKHADALCRYLLSAQAWQALPSTEQTLQCAMDSAHGRHRPPRLDIPGDSKCPTEQLWLQVSVSGARKVLCMHVVHADSDTHSEQSARGTW